VQTEPETSLNCDHNSIVTDPPGAGRRLMACSVPFILCSLSFDGALDVTNVCSVAASLSFETPLTGHRPFCAAHHAISHAALVSGGRWPRQGEIGPAHRGALLWTSSLQARPVIWRPCGGPWRTT